MGNGTATLTLQTSFGTPTGDHGFTVFGFSGSKQDSVSASLRITMER